MPSAASSLRVSFGQQKPQLGVIADLPDLEAIDVVTVLVRERDHRTAHGHVEDLRLTIRRG